MQRERGGQRGEEGVEEGSHEGWVRRWGKRGGRGRRGVKQVELQVLLHRQWQSTSELQMSYGIGLECMEIATDGSA